MAVVLPIGDVVIEVCRGGTMTHRAEITVGSKLDDRVEIAVPSR